MTPISVPNPGPSDPTHLLHAASYALEDLKWDNDWRNQANRVTPVGAAETNQLFARLLEANGLSELDPGELREAVEHYARSWSIQIGTPVPLARTLFIDGLCHGLALAAGLKADPPNHYPKDTP